MNFRQTEVIELRETPVIRVTPVRIQVECVDQQIELRCSVNSPYEVEFENVPGKPKKGPKEHKANLLLGTFFILL